MWSPNGWSGFDAYALLVGRVSGTPGPLPSLNSRRAQLWRPNDFQRVAASSAAGRAGSCSASAGVDVVVLEKHGDFLRDFRGDTIHPSTLDAMGELGLLDEFLKLPHEKAPTISAYFGGRAYAFADFTHLPTRCKFVALMPQWDFLNFLADHGKSYPSFHLRMRAEAIDLIE